MHLDGIREPLHDALCPQTWSRMEVIYPARGGNGRFACCGPRRHFSALFCPSAKATAETTGAKSSPLDTQAYRHHTLRTARGML